jgi:uncharacterized protein (DUF1810 family)
MNDPHNLQRFVEAQSSYYERACRELRSGRKDSHWMWFIFPQLRGLGNSPAALEFGISSRQEAEAYLAHPVLGPRLLNCTGLVNALQGRPIDEIFGGIDSL